MLGACIKKTKTIPVLDGSSYEEAEASPGFLFWKSFNRWTRTIREALEKLDLTQVQYSILAATSYLGSENEHVTQQDISNQLSMDKMMVSDVVKTLEKKKLLMKKAHPIDRRASSLALTISGKNILKKAVPAVEHADELFFKVLGPDLRKHFIASLIRLSSPD